MEIELAEIRDFIALRHPFSTLPEDTLDELVPRIQIRYLRREQAFPPGQTKGDSFCIIRSGAIELLDKDHELVDRLGEGDFYAGQCELIAINPVPNSVAIEDSLIYLLPCETIKRLIKQDKAFKQYFSESVRDHLQQAVRNISETVDYNMAGMATSVSDLLVKPPVTMPANTNIQAAAQCMADNNVSSLMLTDDQDKLIGLITDRDLRSRCVAGGIDTTLPVSDIMTTDLYTIDHNSVLLDAMMQMTRRTINHLPVLDQETIKGILTASDLTRYNSNNPVFITSSINKARNADELVSICQQLPSLQLSLANSGISARHIGETFTCITDALTIRLIEIGKESLGPEPVPFVWIAGGSQARQEQTACSDQDHALIVSDEMQPEHDDYFQQLAQQVSDGLDACGFEYCPGDAMASNTRWRQPLSKWKQYADRWIKQPDPEALVLASIFFDQRPVYGDESLYQQLQTDILYKASSNELFLAHMAANALTLKPPMGFFRTLVLIHGGEHNDTFDIKHKGIAPIINIARIVALAEGIPAVNSTQRLYAARNTSLLGADMSENLRDALEFISSLRIRHQAALLRNNQPADNYLPPGTLSELERKHLKDVFSVIQDMQESLAYRFHTGRLG